MILARSPVFLIFYFFVLADYKTSSFATAFLWNIFLTVWRFQLTPTYKLNVITKRFSTWQVRNSATSKRELSQSRYLELAFVHFVKCCTWQWKMLQGYIGFALFEFFSFGFLICVMTHPHHFQWTWNMWHSILSCSPTWYITLLQPQRDTALSKSALLYKTRPWPRSITVIKWFWNKLRKNMQLSSISFLFTWLGFWRRQGAQCMAGGLELDDL